jgi:hypothetical protein
MCDLVDQMINVKISLLLVMLRNQHVTCSRFYVEKKNINDILKLFF